MRLLRKTIARMLIFVLLMSTLAVPNGAEAASPKVEVKKVTSVNSLTGSKTIYLAQGKKAVLKTTVIVTSDKPANKKVTYKSSNKKVATVTGKGVIKGKKAGTAKITVTSKKNHKKKATVTVKVLKGKVTNVKLNRTSDTLTVGDTVTLKATIKTSKGGRKNVIWKSSDTGVATVKSGTVKAVSAGKAIITVKAADGSGKKAVYRVTVKDKTEDSTTESLTPMEKNTSDVEVLQKLIKEQNALGAMLPTDLNESVYTWDKNGRLTGINWGFGGDTHGYWYGYSLRGTISFEGLTALTSLTCSYNEGLTGLDVSQNTALTYLECRSNQLTNLDVSRNTTLTSLDCTDNPLINLDVSKNTALTSLNCIANQLTNLDVSRNTALTSLDCADNQLTSLDVSQNTALTNLSCGDNQLTTLDLSKNMALTYLSCDNARFTTLDLSKNTALTSLYCYTNQLINLDVSKNTALTNLSCDDNQLTTLDLSKNVALTNLSCIDNQLTTLDLSKNTALTDLECSYNQLTTLDLSKNTALTDLYCYNNQLTTLDLSKNTALTDLHCDNNQLTTLDLSKNTVLTYLSCSGNQLTTLDLSKNTVLTYLWCDRNQLLTLNVSQNVALTDLHCYNNQLTTLDLSKNTALTYLECTVNQLTELNVSNCTSLSDCDILCDEGVEIIRNSTVKKPTMPDMSEYGTMEKVTVNNVDYNILKVTDTEKYYDEIWSSEQIGKFSSDKILASHIGFDSSICDYSKNHKYLEFFGNLKVVDRYGVDCSDNIFIVEQSNHIRFYYITSKGEFKEIIVCTLASYDFVKESENYTYIDYENKICINGEIFGEEFL